jgi:hypothetical protein
MVVVIDTQYYHWFDSLSAWTNASSAIVDTVNIGAGVAGGIAGGLGARITNAVVAFLTGTKSTVNPA